MRYVKPKINVRRTTVASVVALLLLAGSAGAQEDWGGEGESFGGGAGFSSNDPTRLIEQARAYLNAGEHDRGVERLRTVIQQNPEDDVRFLAALELGKHYINVNKQNDAIGYLKQCRDLEQPKKKLTGEKRDILLESLYLTGIAYFQLRQYAASFPVLRKITNQYPNTVWANQAYYYIGMCHFAQENWNKAIDALTLVGTFVDPNSPSIEYIEAGRRLYMKIEDGDLPVLNRLGKDVTVSVQSGSGDQESLRCVPLTGEATVYIGSIPTVIGNPQPDDGKLQVISGDTITTRYYDGNTREGERDVPRRAEVKVVSTASLELTLGNLETDSEVAFLHQEQNVILLDGDLDVSPEADTAEVRVVSRYKEEDTGAEEEGGGYNIERIREGDQERWVVRDEVIVQCTEMGDDAPVRSGRFHGTVRVVPLPENGMVDKNDDVLAADLKDQLLFTYIDRVHIAGESERLVSATLGVAGEIDNRPRAEVYYNSDPIIQAKKNLVEARGFLDLGNIFKSMGLLDSASRKCDEGLRRINDILGVESLPGTILEEAYRVKWEMEIVQDRYDAAVRTCERFSEIFPNSPFVDQALMGVAKVRLEQKDYKEAIGVLQRILELPNSQARGEAMYQIAQAIEKQAQGSQPPGASGEQVPEAAVRWYQNVAEQYPDSRFAGEALAKLADYYIRTKDYTRADDLLEQVFRDHPDAPYLDQMLLKWTLVSLKAGQNQKALEKCNQLIMEYPTSKYADVGRKIIGRIEMRIQGE